MAQSLNTEVELTLPATAFTGLSKTGSMMVGDRAVEFYNERNPEDYIQIPWGEIDHVAASVLFGKIIPRFAIFTKRDGTFSFSTRRNKRCLVAMRRHLSDEQLVRSLSFFQVIGRGIKGIFRRP